MINGISVSGKYTVVHGGYNNMPYVNNNNTSAGMVRYNNGNIEVYDGTTWLLMNGSIATVGISPVAESAIEWAMKKMQEETEMEHLASQHPAVKIAYENMKKAADQLKATIILSKEHDKTTS
jgi:hypothetical protein